MKSVDKLVAVGMFLVAAVLYMSHYALAVLLYPSLTSWPTAWGRMGYALKTVGFAPRVFALLALLVGIYYLVKAEMAERKESQNNASQLTSQ